MVCIVSSDIFCLGDSHLQTISQADTDCSIDSICTQYCIQSYFHSYPVWFEKQFFGGHRYHTCADDDCLGDVYDISLPQTTDTNSSPLSHTSDDCYSLDDSDLATQ